MSVRIKFMPSFRRKLRPFLETKARLAMETQRQTVDPTSVEQWLAIRKEAALHIHPETAEVEWIYVDIADPYGVLAEGCGCFGREYFARSPESDIWVCFDDLPTIVSDALWEKHGSKLAFPAGLPAWTGHRPTRDHTCVQCEGPVDGQEQLCAIGNDVVWLHPECEQSYIAAQDLRW